ncbi:MAG: hypothetical protein V4508_08830 [Pseudomonadota bacterium]
MPETEYGTTEDILHTYSQLSAREKRILNAVACRYVEGTRFTEPLDLIHEALFLAIEGRRRWPRHVNFGIFMVMTMRSIADSDRKRHENKFTLNMPLDELLEWAFVGIEAHPSAEDDVSAAQEQAFAHGALMAARQAFARDDEVARKVLDGMMLDMSANDMRAAFGLSAPVFDAARKRVLRKLRNSARL